LVQECYLGGALGAHSIFFISKSVVVHQGYGLGMF